MVETNLDERQVVLLAARVVRFRTSIAAETHNFVEAGRHEIALC
jgi:hypothetical protein